MRSYEVQLTHQHITIAVQDYLRRQFPTAELKVTQIRAGLEDLMPEVPGTKVISKLTVDLEVFGTFEPPILLRKKPEEENQSSAAVSQ